MSRKNSLFNIPDIIDIDQIEEKRLGQSAKKYEIQFVERIKPHLGFAIERNNEEDEYKIDYKFVRLEPRQKLALIDFEFRTFKLSQVDSIHVPKYTMGCQLKGIFDTLTNKVKAYMAFPLKSFHISWSKPDRMGYLIPGKVIIESPIIEVPDNTERFGKGQIQYHYDVSKTQNKLDQFHIRDDGKYLIGLILYYLTKFK